MFCFVFKLVYKLFEQEFVDILNRYSHIDESVDTLLGDFSPLVRKPFSTKLSLT